MPIKLLAPGRTTRPIFRWTEPDLDGAVFRFRLRWLVTAKFWALDIYAANGTPLARGLAVRAGVALNRHLTGPEHPQGELFVEGPAGAPTEEPGRDSFRSTHRLKYKTAAEVAADAGTSAELG